jgi:hypothetical protein
MDTKREILMGGELLDYPGCWKITVTIEGESGEWSVFRKPDGTYWSVAGVHIFPPGGGTLHIDIGDQIVDEKELAQCDACYTRLQEKAAGQRAEKTLKL